MEERVCFENIEWGTKKLNPRLLFLIDGFGALLSAFLLGVVLTRFETVFGMPRKTLYFLALLPCIFAIYDFTCYFRLTQNWAPFLKAIAFANLMYCSLSIGFVIHHYARLTSLGLIYFLLELVVVIVLAGVELRTVGRLTR